MGQSTTMCANIQLLESLYNRRKGTFSQRKLYIQKSTQKKEREGDTLISLKLAEPNDFCFFYRLKCEPSNIAWSGHDKPPDYEELKHFFMDCIRHQGEADTRKIYLIVHGATPVGHLYFIPEIQQTPGVKVFELAVAISEQHWRRGYAREAIRLGLELGKRLGYTEMRGAIREDNIASLRAFAACDVQITEKYKMFHVPIPNKEVKMFIIRKLL